METKFKAGDILHLTETYAESKGDINKILILRAFKVEEEIEGETVTHFYYVVVSEPTVWDDVYKFAEDTCCRILSEEFIEKNGEMVGHMDISGWLGIIQPNVDEQATELYEEALDKLKDYAGLVL